MAALPASKDVHDEVPESHADDGEDGKDEQDPNEASAKKSENKPERRNCGESYENDEEDIHSCKGL